MKKIKKLKYWARIFSLLATAVISFPTQAVGTAAPDFTLASLNSGNLRLAELQGQVVLLNFWASWCGPCRKEMPILNDLHNRYKDIGFTVLGVNVEQDSSLAQNYLRDTPVDFPILFDTENQVSKSYHVVAMPTTVMINRDGKIRFIHQGYQQGDEEKYKQMIKQLIRE